MDKPALLEPAEFVCVSAVVAEILAELIRDHRGLAAMPAVQVAVLAVAHRYKDRLRASGISTRPDLSGAQLRRELMYFRNTARPLPASLHVTAVDLFDQAMRAIAEDARQSQQGAARAFERAIASIVGVARFRV